jgi:hypothetical protein
MAAKYGSLTDRQRNALPMSSLSGQSRNLMGAADALWRRLENDPRDGARAVLRALGAPSETHVFPKFHGLLLGRF